MEKPTSKRLGKHGGGHRQAIIIIGLVLGLSVGFLDITLSISSVPSGFSSFSFILPPLVATISVFFLLYLLIWLFVGSQLARLPNVEFFPLAVSSAFFLGMIFILVSLNDLIHLSLSATQFFKLFILFSISFMFSIVIYFVTRFFTHIPNNRNAAIISSLVTPFALAEMVLFVWLKQYRFGSFSPLTSLIFPEGYVLAALFTVWLFYRLGQRVRIARLLVIFTTLIVLSLFMSLFAKKNSTTSLEIFRESNHKIKHVILIIIDALRPDFLSCYGRGNISTPYVDQLAKDGILFKRAISVSPWTLPSVASIMTGLSPSVHMTTRVESRLPETLTTLAEYMQNSGYYTAAFGSNWVLLPEFNISQGFIEYNFFPKPSIGESFGVRLLKRIFPGRFRTEVSTRDLTDLACDWFEKSYEKDFLLWIHYYDPHLPYAPPVGFLPKSKPPPAIGNRFSKLREIRGGYFVPSLDERDWIRSLYEAEVLYVDKYIGKLIDTLKQLNLYDDSLIILTSDHGEEFWEHGGFEHGHTLYNEVVWVPLIMKLPLSAARGEINKVVSTASITPTILDLCGIDSKSDYLSVQPLSALWKGNPSEFKEEPIISTGLSCFENRESVIFNGLKYIHFLVSDHEEFYDLNCDPKEHFCIVNSSRDKIQVARDILNEHNKKAKKLREYYGIMNTEKITLEKETKERLKSLGYIQ